MNLSEAMSYVKSNFTVSESVACLFIKDEMIGFYLLSYYEKDKYFVLFYQAQRIEELSFGEEYTYHGNNYPELKSEVLKHISENELSKIKFHIYKICQSSFFSDSIHEIINQIKPQLQNTSCRHIEKELDSLLISID